MCIRDRQFYHLKKAKLSGKKVIVIGRFKESDDIVAFIYSDMNSYRNSNRNPLFITLAIKEIEWEEGEGL